MNNTEKFTQKSTLYSSARPKYPDELLNYLAGMNVDQNAIVADIGSGTGIFSEQLLSLGATVFGVEPNKEMRTQAEAQLTKNKKFHSIDGSADHTKLNNNSVDFITVAQAFHWFNPDTFKKECGRILKTDGKIILVWNYRNLNGEYEKDRKLVLDETISKKRSHDVSKSINTVVPVFFDEMQHLTFTNPITMNKRDFLNYNLSMSFAPNVADKNYSDFTRGVLGLFEKHGNGKEITIPMETVVFIGRHSTQKGNTHPAGGRVRS